MKILGGILIAVIGVVVGLVVFISLFVGGITQAVEAFDAVPRDSSSIAWGLLKATVVAGPGEIVAFLIVLLGAAVAFRE